MSTKNLTITAGWSYNAQNEDKPIAKYKTGSKKEKLSSITLLLGTGNALFNAGDEVTGDGSVIKTYVKAGDYKSDNQYIDEKVGNTGPSGGLYPDVSQCKNYTFTFKNATIPANSEVIIYIKTPGTASGHTGPVLCMGSSCIAEYTEVEDVQYTVTFDARGGSVNPSHVTAYAGSTIQLPRPAKSYTVTFDGNGGSVSENSQKLDCALRGWNTSIDGSGTYYSADANYVVNSNATLYAIWTNPSISSFPTATRSNCKFEKWTTTKNGNDEVTTSTIISNSTTIYAKWKYYIIYKMNGGSIDGDDSNDSSSSSTSGTSDILELKAHGVNYTIGSYYPEKSGSTFYGWNTSPTATIPSYVDGDTYSTNEPLILYAVYNTQTFTVKFTDGYSGTIIKSQKVNYGQNATPPPNPTRKGYEFQGWIGDYTNVKANLTIKAYWGFTPVWIMTSSGWKKYEPKE